MEFESDSVSAFKSSDYTLTTDHEITSEESKGTNTNSAYLSGNITVTTDRVNVSGESKEEISESSGTDESPGFYMKKKVPTPNLSE